MMKRLLIGCILLAYLSSCKKEYSEQFVPYNNNALNNDTAWRASTNPKESNQILAALVTAPLVDSFDVATGGVINFSNGVRISFPVNACVSNTGSLYTGKVKVELTYLKKKGDFIRFAKPTTSHNSLLQSGGSFKIGLSLNGNSVFIAQGKSYKILYGHSNPVSDMKLFYEGNWITNGDTARTWILGDSSAGWVNTWQNSQPILVGYNSGYEITSKKLGWINCDFFNDTSQPYTRMNVSLPLNFTNANTSVYVVFKNKNIAGKLSSDMTTKIFYFQKIPIGSEVTLVTVSKIGNDYYLGKKEVAANNANLISINPETKSLTDLDAYLNSL